ncbi:MULTISPECIES: DUF937 domain-containing protein [unclassified Hyphomonas]|jgi:hypothetical protein|uniref:Mll6900 protein n=4 Tax=root TaxID=1 RepID=A0A160TZF4_9ZZZZ|nr:MULTISPECIES: DUF937 domain-containing protein [unclassified Hyphomonas]MAN90478.1 hypothetical protein [Hyphomonadaceae bacterium]QSR20881.1 hypothetical protein CFA77_01080 [Hyphomonas sp. KY3]MAA81579.1 hypothetical protein [Hyphomonas sp.]MAL43944.1 hypothetical protein [Hyphomonas sp.]MAX84332.1 hypothetical protein [Hyphomonas sp.]|tara:strand:+ start:2094 stop:2735 length:642 start_codon:yes stop_codon:yes gene_type:complete
MAGINLFDMLTQTNNGAAVQQVGQQTGLQPDMAQAAIKALLPAIAGGLQRNVQQPGGLQSLLGALQNGQHEQYLDQPESLAQPNAIADGNAILGHLLGSKDTSRAVAAQAAQKTGLSEQVLKSVLPMVASMAMASLSKQTKKPDMAGALAGMLSGQQPQPAQGGIGGLLGGLLGGQSKAQAQTGAMGMLGGLLDADGDGNAVDDIFQMVMNRR